MKTASGTNFFPSTGTVRVALTDENGDAVLVESTTANIPSGAANYAVGCELIATDTGIHYINTGSTTSSTFSAQPSAASAPFVIRYSGQPTTVGGAAAEAFTVTGVAATDRAFVQIVNDGTANVTALQAVCTTNTLTVTFSGNPGADCVFNYIIVRAA